MPIPHIHQVTVGHYREFRHPGALKAGAAEFFSTLIFVFAGQGAGMGYLKTIQDGPLLPPGLVVGALAHGFGLFVAVAAGSNLSGGHVNPAVTLGACIGGHLTVVRAVLYIIAQLLGSTAACFLLLFSTGGMTTTAFPLSGVSVWNAVVFEIVMTFGLVYTVYATTLDPKKGEVGIIAPLAIGLIVGANILAGSAFTGAYMNPALSFGPSVVNLDFTNHWIYWVGPLIGGGLAAIVYQLIFISHTHEQLPRDDY